MNIIYLKKTVASTVAAVQAPNSGKQYTGIRIHETLAMLLCRVSHSSVMCSSCGGKVNKLSIKQCVVLKSRSMRKLTLTAISRRFVRRSLYGWTQPCTVVYTARNSAHAPCRIQDGNSSTILHLKVIKKAYHILWQGDSQENQQQPPSQLYTCPPLPSPSVD